MRISEPGIYPSIPPDDYFADPAPIPSLTQSIAKILIYKSPAHARLAHPRLAPPIDEDDVEPEKYVAAQAIGNAAHAAMLGRGRDIAEGKFDNWTTKAAKEFKAEAIASGRLYILSKHLDRTREMVKAASYQMEAAGHANAFRVGHGEVMLAWKEDGIWFRSLVDWMCDTTLVYDLKTSGLSCAPRAARERPSTDGWDIQAAMYERGLDVLDPSNAGRRRFIFVAQENAPPYSLTPVEISEHDLVMGRKKLASAVAMWRECIATGAWPGYPAKTEMSRPRGWTEAEWLEREMEEADEADHLPQHRAPMLTDISGG